MLFVFEALISWFTDQLGLPLDVSL